MRSQRSFGWAATATSGGERRRPQDHGVDPDQEQPHRAQDPAAGEGDDGRTEEALHEGDRHAHQQEPEETGRGRGEDRHARLAERERLRHVDEREQHEDDEDDRRIQHDFDDEAAHRWLPLQQAGDAIHRRVPRPRATAGRDRGRRRHRDELVEHARWVASTTAGSSNRMSSSSLRKSDRSSRLHPPIRTRSSIRRTFA